MGRLDFLKRRRKVADEQTSGDESAKLDQLFATNGPWQTTFTIAGRHYGAQTSCIVTDMTPLFQGCFPSAKRILELGSLEGGRTFPLARLEIVEEVVAVEGRIQNIERARLVQRLLGVQNVRWVHGNLEDFDLASLGHFDAVFCTGVLYHVPEPWTLIKRCAQVSRNLFLQTHYARETDETLLVNGHRGFYYQEGVEHAMAGLSDKAFWLTLGSLVHLLSLSGYHEVRILKFNLQHQNGPWVALAASRA